MLNSVCFDVAIELGRNNQTLLMLLPEASRCEGDAARTAAKKERTRWSI